MDFEKIKQSFFEEFSEISDRSSLENLKTKYLGRKGLIAEAFKTLGQLDENLRRDVGKILNEVKATLQASVEEKLAQLQGESVVQAEIDVTLPGRRMNVGYRHPISIVSEEIQDIFKNMGFVVATGPEIETDYYNFTALNFPKDHPARDMQDTLFINDEIVLRTHTSPVQIRTMETQPPPIRIIVPGRVFRNDTPDATHSPIFYQIEGLAVDEGITFGDLKGVIFAFAQKLFGSRMKVRFRPSFFPFTEPSAECDFTCFICFGENKNCKVCKGSGFIETLGCGMVDPNVFKFVHYDPEKYTGYAWGMGVERIALLKYGIDDIRLLYENDVRFLEQFS